MQTDNPTGGESSEESAKKIKNLLDKSDQMLYKIDDLIQNKEVTPMNALKYKIMRSAVVANEVLKNVEVPEDCIKPELDEETPINEF